MQIEILAILGRHCHDAGSLFPLESKEITANSTGRSNTSTPRNKIQKTNFEFWSGIKGELKTLSLLNYIHSRIQASPR